MTIELIKGTVVACPRPSGIGRGSEESRDRQGADAPRFSTFSFDTSPPAYSSLIARVKEAARWFGLACATAGVLFFLLLVAIGILLFNAFSVPVGNRGWPAASQARRC